jgi:hypothetical protein
MPHDGRYHARRGPNVAEPNDPDQIVMAVGLRQPSRWWRCGSFRVGAGWCAAEFAIILHRKRLRTEPFSLVVAPS